MEELDKQVRLAWRRFLSTESGVKGLLWMREQTPRIHGGEPHDFIFQAGKVEGFHHQMNLMSEILTLEEKKDINAENT